MKAREHETPTYSERAIAFETPIEEERARTAETPMESERPLFGPEQMESLRIVTRAFYDYQRERMALDGQLGMTKDGEAKKGRPDRDPTLLMLLLKRRDDILGLEGEMEKEVAKTIHKHPLWKGWLHDVKGVGPMMAAVLVTQFDIHIATTVSKMWQFSGMNPGEVAGKVWKRIKGERVIVATETRVRGDKKTKGFVCPYNAFLKTKLLGVLAGGFLRCGSPYTQVYYEYKYRLESMDWGTASKNPTDPKRPKAGHQHKAASRYMVKAFLRDLYVAWRTLEGLEVRAPYAEEYLSRKHSA